MTHLIYVISIFITLVCIRIMYAVFASFPPAAESYETDVFEKLCSKATCPPLYSSVVGRY